MKTENANGLIIPASKMAQDFCVYYVARKNGTKAAIRAGYSPKTAAVRSSKLLAEPEVQAYIAHLQKEKVAEAGVEIEDLIVELKNVAFSNIGDYLEFSEEVYVKVPNEKFDPEKEASFMNEPEKTVLVGGLKIKDFGDLTDDQLAAVSEVTETAGIYGKSRKFKLHDKLGAIAQLRAMMGFDQPKKSELKVDMPTSLEVTNYSIKKRVPDPEE